MRKVGSTTGPHLASSPRPTRPDRPAPAARPAPEGFLTVVGAQSAKPISQAVAMSLAAQPVGLRVLPTLKAYGEKSGHRHALVASLNAQLLDDREGHEVVDPKTQRIFLTVDPAVLQARGHKVVPWTVNEPDEMRRLLSLKVDGLITDAPDVARAVLAAHRELSDTDGLIDPKVFSLQGHRGARALRPENTLPSMEAGLDCLVNGFETDLMLTRDGELVLSHEYGVDPRFARHADGSELRAEDQRPIPQLTLAELREGYVFDQLLPAFPLQQNDRALSPVSVAFARERGLPDAYTIPTVGDLFDFTRFYADWYRNGPGRDAPDAELKAKNAERVTFNLELKTLPSHERAGKASPPDRLARAAAAVVIEHGLQSRSTLSSFDSRAVRCVQADFPDIGAAYIFDGKTEEPNPDELAAAN
ncbi:MAG: hypothetical protein IPJ65_12645 [Archangiaceae bacterium]|nr:hypothetical protein [Archangiaceae bacterium]